jgi:ABC-2 type transport system permease protein
MLADAIRAETFRLTKNRTAVFWSVLFVPLMAIVFGLVTQLFMKANEAKLTEATGAPPELRQMLAGGPLNMGQALVEIASNLASPVLLLFVLIGAATLFAGDYRWETWRLISARNSRRNLLLAKLATVAGLALAAMGCLLIAGVIENLIRSVVVERPLAFSMTADMVGQFAALTALSWLRIIQFVMMAALAATLTRSLLAALFVPLVFGVAQFFSPQALAGMGIMPDSWIAILANPGAATDALQAIIMGGPAKANLPEAAALKASASLALWTLAPLAGALAWFQRQDLARE